MNWKTSAVAIFCLGGAATGSYLFYLDFTDAGALGKGAPLAQVERFEERVKRKAASTFVWTNIKPAQKLFRRESVQTGQGSSALVRFNDGTVLELRENSLVVIDDLQNLTNNFLKGSMILHQASGDSNVTVGADGQAKVQTLSAQLLTPPVATDFFISGDARQEVQFTWKLRKESLSPPSTPSPISSPTVQVSSDPAFEKFTVAGDSKLSLKAGKYFWRVMRDQEAQSAVGNFSILHIEPPTLIWPSSKDLVEFFGESAVVEFRWLDRTRTTPRALTGARQGVHELEISTDADFKSLSQSKPINLQNHLLRLTGLSEGRYYWRIRSRFANLSVSSVTQDFIVTRATQVAIGLNSPLENTKVPEAATRFSWSDPFQDQSHDYLLELEALGEAGKAPLKEKVHAGTAITLKSIPPGPYRWRVRALAREQVIGESPWRKVSVERGTPIVLLTPQKSRELWHWDQPLPFKFSWNADPLVQDLGSEHEYQLEAAADANFTQSAVSLRTRENSVDHVLLKLTEGHHFWRVQILNHQGDVIKTSESSEFSFGLHPPLPFPASAQPENGISINPLDLETNPVLTWAEVPGAEAYELTIRQTIKADPAANSRSPASEKIWIKEVTRGHAFELKNPPEGTYFWSVRAIDRLKRPGEIMPEKKLLIDAGEPLDSPKALSKEVQ
ncbi:MAG: hypothetical protein H7222_13325 [Methylotenera sp.]|nr:hypothetical protein [Oligoflexia bacterium]